MACLSRPKPHFVSISPNSKPCPLYFTTLRYVNFPQCTKIRARTSLNVTQPTKSRCCRVSVRARSAESDKLPSDVRKRAMEAIDCSGRRVTLGDVVSKAILKLNEAQNAIHALAADTNGFLEVSDDGDVVYVFPKDYRLKLVLKSFSMKIESFLEKGKMIGAALVRVSFGMSLAASCVVGLLPAILSCLFGPKKGDDEIMFIGEGLCTLFDGRFIENVFSIVFGDGDPNQGIEEKRWKMIGQYIVLHGGVVTAEELAPYLDPETTEKMDDYSCMLPVLLRFDGQPEVDAEGNILFYFPSLQRTAHPQRSRAKEYVGRWDVWVEEVEKFLKEKEWNFSKVGDEEFIFAMVLLGHNLFWAFGFVLCSGEVSMPFLSYIFLPLLLMYPIYIGSFFVIALSRPFFIRRRNAKIVRRNEAREQRAKALELPNLFLEQKLRLWDLRVTHRLI